MSHTFACLYCQDSKEIMYRFFDCKSCDVSYNFDTNYKLACINYSFVYSDKQYDLNIYPIENVTRLIYWESYEGISMYLEPDIARILVEVPGNMNIIPSNMMEKFKLLLTFT